MDLVLSLLLVTKKVELEWGKVRLIKLLIASARLVRMLVLAL